MAYLLIRNIRVADANMLSGGYAATPAQPLGLMLFVHALGRKTGSMPTAAAFLYKDSQPQGVMLDGMFRPWLRKGASFIDKLDYAGGGISLSLVPTATMRLTFDLLLEVDEDCLPRRVNEALHQMRVLGGYIEGFDFDPRKDIMDSLETVSRRLRNGFWLVERTDLMNAEDPCGSMVDALTSKEHSWLVPASMGYSLISAPSRDRSGLRYSADKEESYLHAFAEPLLGLAQLVSARSLPEEAPMPFWRLNWIRDDVLVVQNDVPGEMLRTAKTSNPETSESNETENGLVALASN